MASNAPMQPSICLNTHSHTLDTLVQRTWTARAGAGRTSIALVFPTSMLHFAATMLLNMYCNTTGDGNAVACEFPSGSRCFHACAREAPALVLRALERGVGGIRYLECISAPPAQQPPLGPPDAIKACAHLLIPQYTVREQRTTRAQRPGEQQPHAAVCGLFQHTHTIQLSTRRACACNRFAGIAWSLLACPRTGRGGISSFMVLSYFDFPPLLFVLGTGCAA